ncbi:MAG: hypothetical protein QW829_01860 [Candidatus Bathyarchaeia archaeon]
MILPQYLQYFTPTALTFDVAGIGLGKCSRGTSIAVSILGNTCDDTLRSMVSIISSFFGITMTNPKENSVNGIVKRPKIGPKMGIMPEMVKKMKIDAVNRK